MGGGSFINMYLALCRGQRSNGFFIFLITITENATKMSNLRNTHGTYIQYKVNPQYHLIQPVLIPGRHLLKGKSLNLLGIGSFRCNEHNFAQSKSLLNHS